MSKLQVLLASLSICLLATMSSTAMAELLVNGDFEDPSGYLTGWTETNSTLTSVDFTDNAIGGSHSARMIKDGIYSGNLYQDFDFTGLGITGLSDFQIDLDFAILGGASNGNRLFAMLTYNNVGGLVDCWNIYKDTEGYELRGYYYNGTPSRYFESDLYATPTTDIDSDSSFNDGEVPTVNHLTLVGRGYGTANYSTTVTLNSGSYTLTNNFGSGTGVEISRLLFLGESGDTLDKDYLVDNIVVTNLSVVPEPSTMALLFLGMASLAVMRRRRNNHSKPNSISRIV